MTVNIFSAGESFSLPKPVKTYAVDQQLHEIFEHYSKKPVSSNRLVEEQNKFVDTIRVSVRDEAKKYPNDTLFDYIHTSNHLVAEIKLKLYVKRENDAFVVEGVEVRRSN